MPALPEYEFAFLRLLAETPAAFFDGTAPEAVPPQSELRFAWRRLALFAETFRAILLEGKVKRDVKATGGLHALERATREQGSIVFIDNPDPEHTVTGSVFPYIPEITLGPRESFAFVHEAPVVLPPHPPAPSPCKRRRGGQGGEGKPGGEGPKYLSAYAGLVKSDAQILTVHLRPDPHAGARVYVYGEIGQEREIVLFYGGGWGESVTVTFAETPRVYPVGPSQVVALTTALAGRVFFSDDPNDPVLIGPEGVREQEESFALVELVPGRAHTLFFLRSDGSLIEVNVNAPDEEDSDGIEIDEIAHWEGSPGWYRAIVTTEEPMDAVLRFVDAAPGRTVWLNEEKLGETAATFDVRLLAGRNVFRVRTDDTGLRGPILLTPHGGCFEVDIARWRFRDSHTVLVPVVS